MPTRDHLARVARALAQDLGNHAFRSIARMEITEKLRQISGEETTRIKAELAKSLEMELLLQGVRCFPPLDQTSTGDTVRLFHTRTVVASLVDMLTNPGPETDRELANVTKKVKGVWNWTPAPGDAVEGGGA
jgi:hypothetical protein